MGTKIEAIDIIFNKVQQRLMAMLYGDPDQKFYTMELIRMAKSGTGAVQRELSKFLSAELILIEKTGNHVYYWANKSHPIFPELHSIVLKTLC